jgi:phosphate transport system protein
MRDKFHKELDQIGEQLHRLSLEVLENARSARENLIEAKEDSIRAMMARDAAILSQTASIQKGCLGLIALQQPMAVDLRVIVSYLRSADDVERINRSSIHIAEVAKQGLYDKKIPEFRKILALADRVTLQLEQGIEAFRARDTAKARQVIESERKTDEVYGEVFASLLERVKQEDAKASLLMFVSRWLERIGDRAVNLASRAIYIVEGRDVESEVEIGEFKVFPNGEQ